MLEIYLKIEPDLIIKDRDKFALEDQKTEIQLLRIEVDDMKKLLQKKGENPFGYIMVNEKNEPLYYQNKNETTFKKYPEDKKN